MAGGGNSEESVRLAGRKMQRCREIAAASRIKASQEGKETAIGGESNSGFGPGLLLRNA